MSAGYAGASAATGEVLFLQKLLTQRSKRSQPETEGDGKEEVDDVPLMLSRTEEGKWDLSHSPPRPRNCSATEAEANADHYVKALLDMGDSCRFSACAASTWLTAIRDFDSFKPPSERPKRVLVDVGANKGYVIAQFLGLFAAELGHTPQTLQQYLLSIPEIVSIEQKGQVKWSCGSCMDCKEILPPPPVETEPVDENEENNEQEGEGEGLKDAETISTQPSSPQASEVTTSSSLVPKAELRRRSTKHKRLLRPFTPLVHALEPIKITYDLLQGWKDTAAIPDEIFITHNLAVSDVDGEVMMEMPSAFNANKPGEEGAHLMSVSSGNLPSTSSSSNSTEGTDEKNPKLRVQALRIDSFFEKYLGWGEAVPSSSSSEGTVVDFLMLDMEGYDPVGIFSASKSLSSGRVRILVFEYNEGGFFVGNGKLKQVIDHLDDLGFTCYMDGIAFKSRVSGSCWHDKYDMHHLGNVVCVHRCEYELLGLVEAQTRA